MDSKRKLIRLFINTTGAVVGTMICLAASGCLPFGQQGNNSLPVVKDCEIGPDQGGTISGAWSVSPIPIAFQQGAFSRGEMSDIVTAAETWNTFFTASKSFDIYNTASGNPPQSSVPLTTYQQSLCSQAFIQGNQFANPVVIFKLGNWGSFPPNAIALTNFCTQPGSPYPRMFAAVVLLNYQNFFVQGTQLPDLQSVILHELGHLLGLNHSCEGTTRAGFPNCSEPSISQDYLTAVMFPSFSFDQNGVGDTRRQLNANDQGRANCLYSAPGS